MSLSTRALPWRLRGPPPWDPCPRGTRAPLARDYWLAPLQGLCKHVKEHLQNVKLSFPLRHIVNLYNRQISRDTHNGAIMLNIGLVLFVFFRPFVTVNQ